MSEVKRRARCGVEGGYLSFRCPGCRSNHVVRVSPQGSGPGWRWNGDESLPTLEPSIHVRTASSSICHSFVRVGRIEFLADCAHALAGQTVDLPDWPPPRLG